MSLDHYNSSLNYLQYILPVEYIDYAMKGINIETYARYIDLILIQGQANNISYRMTAILAASLLFKLKGTIH